MENAESRRMMNRDQFMAIEFSAVLCPVIRLVPNLCAAAAGRFAWLSVFLSILPLAGLMLFMGRFLRPLGNGEGMASLFTRALGRFFGSLVLLLYALWLLFYAAFIMRSASERFITTIFPNSSPAAFIPAMALLALLTVLDRPKVLARSAEIFRPVLIAALVTVFLLALPSVRFEDFSAPTRGDLKGAALGTLPIVDAVGVLCTLGFLEGYVPRSELQPRRHMLHMAAILGTVLLLCVTTVGTLGPELAMRINNPFFVMIRDLRLFSAAERIEALVIALWFFTDFIMISAVFHCVMEILSHVFRVEIRRGGRLLDPNNGRWAVWLTVCSAGAAALLMAPTTEALRLLSFQLVPTVSLSLVFILLPLVFIIGRLRRRL